MVHKSIMRISPIALFCSLIFLGVSVLSAQDNWPTERKERAKKAGEERMAFATSKNFEPYASKNSDALKKVNALMEKNDFETALKEVDEALAADPCDIDLWICKSSILRTKGDEAKANEARQRWFGLVDSILMSGDGKSFETAFKVISVREEYSLMSILGIAPGDQYLVVHEGVSFDKRMVTTRDGSKITLYFNVDIPLKHLQKKLLGSEENPKK